jgi:hypothetical protein
MQKISLVLDRAPDWEVQRKSILDCQREVSASPLSLEMEQASLIQFRAFEMHLYIELSCSYGKPRYMYWTKFRAWWIRN